MKVSNKVIELSSAIIKKAYEEADYLPIDRKFLEKYYMTEVLKVDRYEFMLCNFERRNNTYTTQLFKCLPELWYDMTYERLQELVGSFTHVFAFFSLIEFCYKYLGIDLFEMVLTNPTVPQSYKSEIINYFMEQFPNLIDDEDSLREGFSNVGTRYEEWVSIKQKILTDARIQPAVQTYEACEERLIRLYEKYHT